MRLSKNIENEEQLDKLRVLEKRKLECEIKQLESDAGMFSWKVSFGDLIPIFIAVLTVVAAYSSGILDVKRMQLSTEKTLFEIETKEAEIRAERAKEQVARLEQRLELSRVVIGTQKVLREVVERCNALDRCRASLDLLSEPPVLNLSLVGTAQSRDFLPEMLTELEQISDGFHLRSLSIKDFRLTRAYVDSIKSLQPEELTLSENNLTDHEFAPLTELTRIKKLTIDSQRIQNLMQVAQMVGLRKLKLSGTPLTSGQFDRTFASAQSLETISIANVEFAASDGSGIGQFEKLKSLRIEWQAPFPVILKLIESYSFDLVVTLKEFDEQDESFKQILECIGALNREESERRIVLMTPESAPEVQGDGVLAITTQSVRMYATDNMTDKE